ncbi:MAG: hypothetical protein ACI9GB_002428 [Halioglobus sp.]|jgi:hypothetical protein
MHRLPLEIDLLRELFFNFLLHFVLHNTFATARVLHPLGVTLTAIVSDHALKPTRFDFSGNEFFNEGDINTYPIGNAAGANFVGVKLRHYVYLFLARMNTLPRVTIGR